MPNWGARTPVEQHLRARRRQQDHEPVQKSVSEAVLPQHLEEKLRHLQVLAHVQLDDDPQTPIQQSVGVEFRQHDSVVTILMYYCGRASPKLRYNIIDDYGGRGRRTRLRIRSRGSTCVHGVPLASVYKGWRRRRPAKGRCGQDVESY